MKTPAIGKLGIVDEKVTFQYGGEQMLLCELLAKKNSRQVGVSRISLQQIPTQQRAQPNGFRVLNSGRKQIASLGITLFKTDRNALATEGSNILNASIGRDGSNNENRRASIQRRMSGTAPNNVYAPFTVNPVGLDQQRQQRQNQPAVAMQHRPSQEEVNHNNNAVAVRNKQQFPAETYAQLRAILGNISDEEANKMLEDFNGNVESCINYYFASGQHPKVENVLVAPVVVAPPSISKPRPTAPVLPNTRSAPVLQTDRNANNTKAEVRRRALSVQKFDAGALGHLRAIVGDISDEFDDVDDLYTKLDNSNYIFEGKTTLKDFCKILKLEDDEFENEKGEAETLAGLILEVHGLFPRQGQTIPCKNFTFKINNLEKKRIKQVHVKLN